MNISDLKWAFFSYGHNLGDFTRALETAKRMIESGAKVKFFNHGGVHNNMIYQAKYMRNATILKEKVRSTDGVKRSVEIMNNFILNKQS